MVNESEKQVVEKYEREGWKALRGGAPDFLMLKVDNGEIQDFEFVEVKPPNERLTYAQSIYRKILERLGAKYKVETIQSSPSRTTPIQTNSYQTRPTHTNPNQLKPYQSSPSRTKPTHTNSNGGENP